MNLLISESQAFYVDTVPSEHEAYVNLAVFWNTTSSKQYI